MGSAFEARETSVKRVLIGLLFLASLLRAGDGLAQQPAQRILPSSVVPTDEPEDRTVCLPQLDYKTKLFIQPCKTFHRGRVPPDAFSRRLSLLTRSAPGPFWTDLDPVKQAVFAKAYPATVIEPRAIPRHVQIESLQKWFQYLAILPTPGGAPAPRGDTSPALMKKGFYPPVPAPPVFGLRSLEIPSGAPWSVAFTAKAGVPVTVAVQDVQPIPGFNWPDPVVWLVRLEQTGDPESGQVVAIGDDEDQGLPLLSYTPSEQGRYRVIVAPYRATSAGTAFVVIKAGQEVLLEEPAAPFGGIVHLVPELLPGDLVFAGAEGADGAENHDAMLTLLPAPWAAPDHCRYAAANNTLDLLPLLKVEQRQVDCLLIAGGYLPEANPAARVFISRISGQWDATGAADKDKDSLSEEIEDALGTCDGPIPEGSQGQCNPPLPLPGGWAPHDTDNDGMSDFAEVFGVRRCLASAPASPYYGAADCIRNADHGRCRFFCPPQTAAVAQLPLSALDAPDPTVYDIYVEYDYWRVKGTPGGANAIPDDQVRLMRQAFEKDFQHEAAPEDPEAWFVASQPPTRFHFFQDDPVPMLEILRMAHIPASASRYLLFDLFFTPDRKYTETFHFVAGVRDGAGQSDLLGRSAIVGAKARTTVGRRLVHEIGHLLGLRHNHDRGRPNHSPFYLSVMSYGYANSQPPPADWDGLFRPCVKNNDCGELFKCSDFGASGRLCAPDCGIIQRGAWRNSNFPRFSTGSLPLPPGTSEHTTIPETGFPRWFLPYLYCYNDGSGSTPLARRLERFTAPACESGRCVQCSQDTCNIDWNRDGGFRGAQRFDVDRDGKISDTPLADHADRLTIIDKARRGLGVSAKKTLVAFYTGFTTYSARNVLPYPSLARENHGGYVTDVTNHCDEEANWPHCKDQKRNESALFRGPASGDGAIDVTFNPGFCVPLEDGLAVSIRAKPLHIPQKDFEAVLLHSKAATITLYGRGNKATWKATLHLAGGKEKKLTVSDPRALGRWTRLTLMVNNKDGQARLSARRDNEVMEDKTTGVKVEGTICDLTLGARADEPTNFMGFVDDPMFISGPVREL